MSCTAGAAERQTSVAGCKSPTDHLVNPPANHVGLRAIPIRRGICKSEWGVYGQPCGGTSLTRGIGYVSDCHFSAGLSQGRRSCRSPTIGSASVGSNFIERRRSGHAGELKQRSGATVRNITRSCPDRAPSNVIQTVNIEVL